MKSDGKPLQSIGGFFGLALSDVTPVADSVWNEWTRGAKVVATRTARAALARLITHVRPRHVWLPAYICPELASAVDPASLRFYPLDDKLSPDNAVLRSRLGHGDLVVAVDFFGWPLDPGLRRLASERADIIWVEDRAQALWFADEPWADWQLFSPRKLLGVPDGGLLVNRGNQDLPEPITGHINPAIVTPELMRFEDQQEADNAVWYAAFRAREQALTAEALPASRLTRGLLERIAIGPLVANRRRNHAFLSSKLSSLAAWPAPPEGIAPFGFVISVDDAGGLAARLATERLFCARHWATLPSDGKVFAREHSLSRHLLTLPCDHRYNESDLERIVEAVIRLV
jgi:hypothetical protein